MKNKGIEIKLAYDEIDAIKELFIEYREKLVNTYSHIEGVNFCFISFKEELNSLSEIYKLPKGRLYIAKYNNEIAGCVALKPIDNKLCEVKRLYVKKEFRGLGIGKLLMDTVIKDAKELNYKTITLETFKSLEVAVHIYYKLGFRKIEKNDKALDANILYMELDFDV